jgi:two-component system, OmpR family, sensor histidine kinase BaeS
MRILHQLTLLLAAAVLLAVALVSAAVAWNLRTGFVDYLHARDQTELARLARRVEVLYAHDPQLQTLRTSRPAMRELIDSLLPNQALRPQTPAPQNGQPPPGIDAGASDQAPPSPSPSLPPPPSPSPSPPRPPPATGPSPHVLQRATLVDTQGQYVAGPPLLNSQDLLRSPVRMAGSVVAYAVSARAPELAGLDAQFLRQQYLQLAVAAGATLVAAGCAAGWVARRWSRPLEDVKRAAQRIAQGDYAVTWPGGAAHGQEPKPVAVAVAGAGAGAGAGAAGGVSIRTKVSTKISTTLEIAELQRAVGAMALSLQNMDGSRKRWLAHISHELRTPLTVLRGELEALQDGARSPTPALLANLHDEAEHISRLVADLHTLAVADLQGMPCSFDWGDAATWLPRSVQRFAALAEQAGLTLHLQAAPSATVYWDFERLAQVMAALLDNSLRYTQSPGRLEVKASLDAHLKRYAIELSDSAPGVPAAELPQLFDPLFRASHPRQSGSRPGSGLGLAIAKSIVVAHGGHISASPSDLGGIRIVVNLPWEAA